MTRTTNNLRCAMENGCVARVTHIGEKGWIYCKSHAIDRRYGGQERTRTLRAWELRLLEAGKPVPSYTPIAKPVAA